jgi:hypothetical protein
MKPEDKSEGPDTNKDFDKTKLVGSYLHSPRNPRHFRSAFTSFLLCAHPMVGTAMIESRAGMGQTSSIRLAKSMNVSALFNEIVAVYSKHGWQLRRVLLSPEAKAGFDQTLSQSIPVIEWPIDALWFSRPSHSGREAWELRLLSENQYALFETFEADETDEERDEMILEMENRLLEYVSTKQTS